MHTLALSFTYSHLQIVHGDVRPPRPLVPCVHQRRHANLTPTRKRARAHTWACSLPCASVPGKCGYTESVHSYKEPAARSAWVAQSLERPPLAQVMISWFVSSSPGSGSLLSACQRAEPASEPLSPHSLPLPCLCSPHKEINTKKSEARRRKLTSDSAQVHARGDTQGYTHTCSCRLQRVSGSSPQAVMTSGLYHSGLVYRFEALRLPLLAHRTLPLCGLAASPVTLLATWARERSGEQKSYNTP